MRMLRLLSISISMGMATLSAEGMSMLEPVKKGLPIEEKLYFREGIEQKSLAWKAKELAVEEAAPSEKNEEQSGEHIPVGSRAMPHSDYVQHQEEQALELADSRLEPQEEVSAEQIEVVARGLGDEEPIAKKTYFTSHQGGFHRAIAVTFLGEQVTTEDGTVWNVASWDRWKTLNWFTTDTILVMQNKYYFSSYKFMLVNQNTGDQVEVNMGLGPLYAGVYTHWVIAVDYLNCEVYLEDGSVWQIDSFDYGVINKWLINDTVIIGVNESGSLFHPNILINVNMVNYARGICLN